MSKFFAEGNVTDSDQSNDSDQNTKQQKKKVNYQYEEQYHGHEEKRKILTEKEKKKSLFKKLGGAVMNALNNKDWDKVWDNMQEMLKEVQKASKFIEKQGTPTSFLKTLNQVNEEVTGITPEEKKKMKNPKSFNIMKQKLKNKIIPDFEKELKQVNNLVTSESQATSELSEHSNAQSDESESEVYRQYLNSDDPMVRRKYWLKREVKKKVEQKSSSESQRQTKNLSNKPKFNIVEAKAKQQLIIADSKEAEIKIKKISADFAKITNQQKRQEYLYALDTIIKESKKYKDFERLSILLADIPIRIEVTRQMKNNAFMHFPRQSWLKLFKHLQIIFEILRESEDEYLIEKIVHFEQNSEENVIRATQKSIYELIRSFIMNLERQLNKSFNYLEIGELEYSERLQDLIKFTEFSYKLSKELSFKEELEKCGAQIAFKVLENCYYMSASFMSKINQFSQVTFTELADAQTLELFVKPILKLRNQEITTKTILYLVYNHALNQRENARDILATSNVPEIISRCDFYTQTCFNRVIVQLGISSFCRGSLDEARQILDGICGLGKSKEQNKEYIKSFLAQKSQKTQGQVQKIKMLPYYLHLNVDVIEAVELMSSMVIQIPYTLNEGGRIGSKTFKRVFYEYQRSHFLAEPLNFRDLIYAASNDLKLGNWKECYEKLLQVNIWSEIENASTVKENLLQCVKQSALRCYLLANRKCFKCVSIAGLVDKFQLDLKSIRKLLCKWINQKQKELAATITDDDYLNILEKRRDTQSDLQRISEKLFLKLEDINAANEQVLSQKPSKQQQNDEGQFEGESKFQQKINVAMTDKLKTILSRRAG